VRSTLEIAEGEFEHALLTTYSVNLQFVEDWVYPALRRVGVRNIVLLADHLMLGGELDDRRVRRAGRLYQAVGVRLGPGAFHPKIVFLHGKSGTRAVISSANLTVGGQFRNIESAIVLDSSRPDHVAPLADLADFFRRVGDSVPAPALEGLLAALPETSAEREPSPLRVVHNLDEPIANVLEPGDLVAVTPYADAGNAARQVMGDGRLRVIVDGEAFRAPSTFFDGGWNVEPRSFEHGRLHGKAIWSDDSLSWLLIGSPNLSEPALLRTVGAGNTEVAVLIRPHQPVLVDVGGEPWAGSIRDAAVARLAPVHDEPAEPAIGAFNAWETENGIEVTGLVEGAEVEYFVDDQWLQLGTVEAGTVATPENVRPYLIRAFREGHELRAVVHRTAQLRQARLSRTSSRSADVVTRLPLDLEGVRALEGVLGDLYALASLATDGEVTVAAGSKAGGKGKEVGEDSLTEWLPAREDDEPRVPALYRSAWKGEPDALLALVRGALRLGTPDDGRALVLEEELLDVLVDETANAGADALDDQPPKPDEPPKDVAGDVLKRYRSSIAKLLDRGVEFVRTASTGSLADLGFSVLLEFHERLARADLYSAGEPVSLIEADQLLRNKLDLLDAYLVTRQRDDMQCLATAAAHLSECLAGQDLLAPIDRERLSQLAYDVGRRVLTARNHLSAVAEALGTDPSVILGRVGAYADRAEWAGALVQADQLLDHATGAEGPVRWVGGSDWFDRLDESPAWRLAGYAAIAGFASGEPFGVVVRNERRGDAQLSHVVVVEPANHLAHELWQRRVDDAWLLRTYRQVQRGDMDDANRFGWIAVNELPVTSNLFKETSFDELPSAVRSVVDASSGVPTSGRV
jgi:hypothetical protein